MWRFGAIHVGGGVGSQHWWLIQRHGFTPTPGTVVEKLPGFIGNSTVINGCLEAPHGMVEGAMQPPVRFWAQASQTLKTCNMKIVITAAALCLGMFSAQAQSEKVQDASAPHNCLTSTTDKDWSSLGLSSEQSAKVKELQTEWRKAESSKSVNTKTATKTSPVMDSYEAKVKDVLTPEQYDNWVKWCSTHASKQMKHKVEPASTPEEDMTE